MASATNANSLEKKLLPPRPPSSTRIVPRSLNRPRKPLQTSNKRQLAYLLDKNENKLTCVNGLLCISPPTVKAVQRSTNMDESIDGFLHLVAGAVPFRKRLKIWFLISDYMNCIIDEGPAQQEIVRLIGSDECETLVADTLRRLSLTRLIMDGAREPLVDDILESLVSFADKCNKANFISVHEAIRNASEYAHRVVPENGIASAPHGRGHCNSGQAHLRDRESPNSTGDASSNFDHIGCISISESFDMGNSFHDMPEFLVSLGEAVDVMSGRVERVLGGNDSEADEVVHAAEEDGNDDDGGWR